MKNKANQKSDFNQHRKAVSEKLVLKFDDNEVSFFVDHEATANDLAATLLQAALEYPNLFEAMWTASASIMHGMGEQDKAQWMLSDGMEKAKAWAVIEQALDGIDLIEEF
jgi:hypothetical protein